jgi:hypothetical protein
MEYTFLKPYEFEGEKYEKIDIDLDKASGWMTEKATRLYRRNGGTATVPYFEGEWCVFILHELTNLPLEFFKGLPAKDYCELTLNVSNFFVG